MLRATMKYGAIGAKVMALYGRLLSPEDWRRICECASVSDVILFLKNHSGWSKALSSLSPNASGEEVSQAAEKELWSQYEKLYKFSYLEDKRYLDFFLYRADMERIVAAIGGLCADRGGSHFGEVSEFVLAHSSVDSASLQSCTDLKGLADAAAGSIYEDVLRRLSAEKAGGKPDYAQAAVLLENQYYKAVFAYVTKKYTGMGRAKLIETVGAQADLLNIASLLRLFRYFPASRTEAQSLLIPVHYRLTPQLMRRLSAAESEEQAMELLQRSPCRRYLPQGGGERPEVLYDRAMGDFCARLIKAPSPSLSTPQAYLILKEMECRRLIRIVQAVSYGLDPKTSL